MALVGIICGCSDDRGTNSNGIIANRYIIVAEAGDLFLVDIINEDTFRLTGDAYTYTDYNAQFINNGQKIVWQRHEYVGNESTYEVWTMNSDASDKFIIFYGLISQIGACSDNNEVVMCDTTNMLRIYSQFGEYMGYLAVDGGHKYMPQWSPDGSRVAYLTRGDFFSVPTAQDNPNIVILASDNTGRLDLITENKTEIYFQWIDNDNLAIVRDDGVLYSKNIETGDESVLDDYMAFSDYNLYRVYTDCTPDGLKVFYISTNRHLYSYDIGNKTRQDISNGLANECALSRDGTKIAYSDGMHVCVIDLSSGDKKVVYTHSSMHNVVYIEDFY